MELGLNFTLCFWCYFTPMEFCFTRRNYCYCYFAPTELGINFTLYFYCYFTPMEFCFTRRNYLPLLFRSYGALIDYGLNSLFIYTRQCFLFVKKFMKPQRGDILLKQTRRMIFIRLVYNTNYLLILNFPCCKFCSPFEIR